MGRAAASRTTCGRSSCTPPRRPGRPLNRQGRGAGAKEKTGNRWYKQRATCPFHTPQDRGAEPGTAPRVCRAGNRLSFQIDLKYSKRRVTLPAYCATPLVAARRLPGARAMQRSHPPDGGRRRRNGVEVEPVATAKVEHVASCGLSSASAWENGTDIGECFPFCAAAIGRTGRG